MEDEILIDNYLKGLLSEDEKKSFLERLNSDSNFKAKFELEKQLFDTLNDDSWSFVEDQSDAVNDYVKLLNEDDLINLKKSLATANFNNNANKLKPTKRLFYYLAAASIIVLIGFQLFFNQSVSNQELYNNYVALDDLPSFVSRSDSNEDLANAQKLFEDKKYEDALTIFQSQLNENSDQSNVLIYQGLAQTELDKFDDAEATFNTLINSNLLDSEKGYWYKALLFIKIDRVEDAKQLLNKIINESLFNHEKAKQLLSEL